MLRSRFEQVERALYVDRYKIGSSMAGDVRRVQRRRMHDGIHPFHQRKNKHPIRNASAKRRMCPRDEIHSDYLMISGQVCCDSRAKMARGSCDEDTHGSELFYCGFYFAAKTQRR